MNSREIAGLIGRRRWLRRLAFLLIRITTLREWYIRRSLREIGKSLSPDFAMLDLGCGMGQHVYACASKWPLAHITGLEMDPMQAADLADFIKRAGFSNVTVLCEDAERWSSQQTYDLVLCGSVLEHLQDDKSMIDKIKARLHPGGWLLVYVPSGEVRVIPMLARKMERDLRASGKPLPHDHVRYYSPAQMRARLQQAGLTVVSERITYGRWGKWAYDMVTLVQFSRFFKFIFPFYLILLHPWVLLLMWFDVLANNRQGNGLLMIARKPN
jgi:2-polyprenyl-3-methyl-5-hydroxy-6-metoxy-1,4-benzoquinol methylase